jgi:hypothetical protein
LAEAAEIVSVLAELLAEFSHQGVIAACCVLALGCQEPSDGTAEQSTEGQSDEDVDCGIHEGMGELVVGNDLDLDGCLLGECSDLNGRSCRVIRSEVAGVDLVHRREIGEISEVDS